MKPEYCKYKIKYEYVIIENTVSVRLKKINLPLYFTRWFQQLIRQ